MESNNHQHDLLEPSQKSLEDKSKCNTTNNNTTTPTDNNNNNNSNSQQEHLIFNQQSNNNNNPHQNNLYYHLDSLKNIVGHSQPNNSNIPQVQHQSPSTQSNPFISYSNIHLLSQTLSSHPTAFHSSTTHQLFSNNPHLPNANKIYADDDDEDDNYKEDEEDDDNGNNNNNSNSSNIIQQHQTIHHSLPQQHNFHINHSDRQSHHEESLNFYQPHSPHPLTPHQSSTTIHCVPLLSTPFSQNPANQELNQLYQFLNQQQQQSSQDHIAVSLPQPISQNITPVIPIMPHPPVNTTLTTNILNTLHNSTNTNQPMQQFYPIFPQQTPSHHLPFGLPNMTTTSPLDTISHPMFSSHSSNNTNFDNNIYNQVNIPNNLLKPPDPNNSNSNPNNNNNSNSDLKPNLSQIFKKRIENKEYSIKDELDNSGIKRTLESSSHYLPYPSQGKNNPNNNNNQTEQQTKKSRWRPSVTEKEILEFYWANNQYPDKTEKSKIVGELNGITIEQVSRWFKHKRENLAQKGEFSYKAVAVKKFSTQELELLEKYFKSEPYPNKDKLTNIANEVNIPVIRVKNWFKSRRVKLNQKGEFEFKARTSPPSSTPVSPITTNFNSNNDTPSTPPGAVLLLNSTPPPTITITSTSSTPTTPQSKKGKKEAKTPKNPRKTKETKSKSNISPNNTQVPPASTSINLSGANNSSLLFNSFNLSQHGNLNISNSSAPNTPNINSSTSSTPSLTSSGFSPLAQLSTLSTLSSLTSFSQYQPSTVATSNEHIPLPNSLTTSPNLTSQNAFQHHIQHHIPHTPSNSSSSIPTNLILTQQNPTPNNNSNNSTNNNNGNNNNSQNSSFNQLIQQLNFSNIPINQNNQPLDQSKD